MTTKRFYSVPPAGNKIQLPALRALADTPKGQFIQKATEYTGTSNLLYLSSGRAALWLILKAMSRLNSKRKKVVIPAYTCPAVASSILEAGLIPVLVDLRASNFGFSLVDFVRKIGSDVLAVVAVHLLGYPTDISEIMRLCRQNGSFLIEDAAQGFGNTFSDTRNTKLGLLADTGFFSFGRGKPLTALHGGLIVTKSDEIFQEAKRLYDRLPDSSLMQNFKAILSLSAYSLFSHPRLYWLPQKAPFLHIGETIFEADFIRGKGSNRVGQMLNFLLDQVEREKELRRQNSDWYYRSFSLMGFSDISLKKAYPYLRYPFFIAGRSTRDGLLKELRSSGTGAGLLYPCPLNQLPLLRDILKDNERYPNARMLSDTLITLPVHSGVTQYNRMQIEAIVLKRAVFRARKTRDDQISPSPSLRVSGRAE